MKKIFVVAGELSGDRIGAWYVKKLRKNNSDLMVCAVGGDSLIEVGAKIFERIEKLNIVGGVEVIKHLWFIFSFMKRLENYIVSNDFDEIVLVDFPGFNLRLLKKLKGSKPELKVTYLSPPQTWIWGEGRIKKLKRYCDHVVVLYPFEVNWYEQRGLSVEWLGYPFYKNLELYFSCIDNRTKKIAIIPASRSVEVRKLLPFFVGVIKKIKLAYPDVQVVLPLASSVDERMVLKIIRKVGLQDWGKDIRILCDEQEKWKELSSCCVALAKPGTMSLELALLGIPTVIAYKTSWITYYIAKMLVKIKCMALPNLLLGKEVFKEFIQGDCKRDPVYRELCNLYREFLSDKDKYKKRVKEIVEVREILK